MLNDVESPRRNPISLSHRLLMSSDLVFSRSITVQDLGHVSRA